MAGDDDLIEVEELTEEGQRITEKYCFNINGRPHYLTEIYCAKCNKSVSITANICPHCNADMIKVKEEILQEYRLREGTHNIPYNKILKSYFETFKARGEKDAYEYLASQFLLYYRTYTIRDDKITELWIYEDGVFVPEGITYIKEFCRNVFRKYYSIERVKELLERISVDTYIKKDEFFDLPLKNINEIPVLNGVLNLTTRVLSSFSPDKVFFNKLPVYYEKKAEIKEIKQFIEDIVIPEDVLIIQELMGYCLYRDYNIHNAFMFLGAGSNGKSRLTEVIKRFLGEKNCSNLSLKELEKNDFAASEIHNKMVNISGDIGATIIKDTEKFKQLTGKDRIGANRKFKSHIYFTNYAKWINACNELPKSRDYSEGFFRRWILIMFPYTFKPKKEYDLIPETKRSYIKLAKENIVDTICKPTEMSGLLNWALDGLQRLLQKGSFSYSKTTEQTQKAWLRESNSFQAFLDDEVILKYGVETSKNDLREKYAQFCMKHKVRPETDTIIRNTLTMHGVYEKRITSEDADGYKTRELVWCGIEFKTEVQVKLG